MVTVKLVEKSVKRKVGIVMVVKVMSQYRIPGMTLMRKRIILQNTPNHEPVFCISFDITLVEVARISVADIVEFRLVVGLWKAEEAVPERDMIVCGILLAELAAVATVQFQSYVNIIFGINKYGCFL